MPYVQQPDCCEPPSENSPGTAWTSTLEMNRRSRIYCCNSGIGPLFVISHQIIHGRAITLQVNVMAMTNLSPCVSLFSLPEAPPRPSVSVAAVGSSLLSSPRNRFSLISFETVVRSRKGVKDNLLGLRKSQPRYNEIKRCEESHDQT